MLEDIKSVYHCPKERKAQVISELAPGFIFHGDLILSQDPPVESFWSLNTWLSPKILEISSINDAKKKLTTIGRNWHPYIFLHPRRAHLIQEALPHVSAKPLQFCKQRHTSPIGSWTLMTPNQLLLSYECTSTQPNGSYEFVEDKISPPNRAYLKLWEVFTRLGFVPSEDSVGLEIGASPGGWTWVLVNLLKQIYANDRAELVPNLQTHPKVSFLFGDAFKLRAQDYPTVDWVFSDVICYPEKLFTWCETWLQEKPTLNMIVTLKFQGDQHYDAIRLFKTIANAKLIHLYHNKHELTCAIINNERVCKKI